MEEIVKKIEEQYAEFSVNAANNLKGNKTAGVRARKNALAMMSLCKEFRKLSVEKDK